MNDIKFAVCRAVLSIGAETNEFAFAIVEWLDDDGEFVEDLKSSSLFDSLSEAQDFLGKVKHDHLSIVRVVMAEES